MEQKTKTILNFSLVAVLILILAVFIWIGRMQKSASDYDLLGQVQKPKSLGLDDVMPICTQEAKLCLDGSSVGRTGPNCEFAPCPKIVGIENRLVIISPKPEEEIESPVTLTGRAVGGWFFEASFPVSVEDENGNELGKGVAEFVPSFEGEEWMTGNYVSFKAELDFDTPSTETGNVVFTKDNPSGNSELDESFQLPVKFKK